MLDRFFMGGNPLFHFLILLDHRQVFLKGDHPQGGRKADRRKWKKAGEHLQWIWAARADFLYAPQLLPESCHVLKCGESSGSQLPGICHPPLIASGIGEKITPERKRIKLQNLIYPSQSPLAFDLDLRPDSSCSMPSGVNSLYASSTFLNPSPTA